MKTPARFHATLAGLLAALVATPSARAAAPSLCADGEQVVFSCRLGPKLVSLCAAPRTEQSPVAPLQYRIGRPGKTPEMRYPASAADGAGAFQAGRTTLAGGGGAWLEFSRGPHRYVVFSFWIRGQGEVAGVAVETGGTRQATLRCRGAVTSQLGPDYFDAAGLAPAKDEFLP